MWKVVECPEKCEIDLNLKNRDLYVIKFRKK